MGGLASGDATLDHDRFAGGELTVHARGADPDALLAAALAQPVELGSVEQLAEDAWDLALDDARAVVGDDDAVPVLGHLSDLDLEIGQDPGLLAGVERVVDRLLDRGQQRLGGAVEAQQVPVLGEELADRDLLCLAAMRLGGGPSSGLGLVGLGRSSRRILAPLVPGLNLWCPELRGERSRRAKATRQDRMF